MKNMILIITLIAISSAINAVPKEKIKPPTPSTMNQITQEKMQEIEVEVKGMVCSFCAQGIKKEFKKHPAVQDVKISLKTKKLHLKLNPNHTLKNKHIKHIIKEAGYNVKRIKR